VTNFLRSLFPPAGLQPAGARRLTQALGLTALVSAALLSFAAPAGAVVTEVGTQKYGVEPATNAAAAKPSTPLTYEGGPVVHSNAPYAVYWDREDAYAEWEGVTAGFLERVGGAQGTLGNVYAVATQYTDATGSASYSSAFHGAYTDVTPYPATENCTEPGTPCLTDAQIQGELTKYIAANHLPTGLNPSGRPTPIYFIFTPPGVTVCLESGAAGHCSNPTAAARLCSYHSYMSVDGATVLYAVQPWTVTSNCQDGGALEEPSSGEAEVILNEVATEQIAATTDPLLTGWHDTSGVKNEVPDKCRNEFSPVALGFTPPKEFNQTIQGVQYYLNDEFNQAALYEPYPGNPCLHGVTVAPRFTAPNPVHSAEPVTFNSTESYVDLGIAKYHWHFGDNTTAEVNCEGRIPTYGFHPWECNASSGIGNPNPVASVAHEYTYAGTYQVTLKVTDDGGNEATVTKPITVFGLARPVESLSVSSAQSTQGSTGSSSSSANSAATAKPPATPPSIPLATQAVVSRSLRSVLRSGLLVRYSVNERIAGHFEVLLATSTARRLGIHGPPATGLPVGTPPQTVIAKAILVTTTAGRSVVKIQFGKATAARLHRLGSVSLMLRLLVRNGSTGTTTVLSTFTLSH
jgi:PKD domain